MTTHCNCNGNLIPSGNDFYLAVTLKSRSLVDGEVVETPFDFEAADTYNARIYSILDGKTLSTMVGLKDGTTDTVIVDAKGVPLIRAIGVEVTGKVDGRAFRAAEKGFLSIVEFNGEAHVVFTPVTGGQEANLVMTLTFLPSAAVVGKNAYEIWKEEPGNQDKTLADFIYFLGHGESAYEIAVRYGYTGTEAEYNMLYFDAVDVANTAGQNAQQAADTANEMAAQAQDAAELADAATANANNAATAAAATVDAAIDNMEDTLNAAIAAQDAEIASKEAEIDAEFATQTALINQKQMEIGAVPSDLTPTAGSTNWVTSGGVYSSTPTNENNNTGADLDISDENGNVLARFSGGDFKVKNFNSETDAPTQGGDGIYGDLEVADENGNILCIFENGNIRTKNFNSANINIKDERFIFVAASNSTQSDKDKADYICSGTNDETTINAAISQLNGNGKLLLAKGNYYIDTFTQTSDGYAAILLDNNSTGTIIIEGDEDSYGHIESQKIKLIISSTAYTSLNSNDFYSIIRHNAININRHLVVNNIGFEIYDNQKKIICIDALYSGSINAYNCVGKVTQHPATWNANPPSSWVIPNEDCVFFRGLSMSQNSNDTIRYCIAESFGVGFAVQGEHIELNSCASVCCQYGYTFNKYSSKSTGGAYCHPMLVINCLDEMCANYPKFYNNTFRQSVRIINYHAEHKPAWFALGGKYAEELTTGQWYGFINYANQMFGNPYNLQNSPSLKFWEAGNGKNVISINDAQSFFATTSERNSYAPNYGQQIYDTTLNKLCICKDTNPVTWVDANGQIV